MQGRKQEITIVVCLVKNDKKSPGISVHLNALEGVGIKMLNLNSAVCPQFFLMLYLLHYMGKADQMCTTTEYNLSHTISRSL